MMSVGGGSGAVSAWFTFGEDDLVLIAIDEDYVLDLADE